MTPNEAGTRLAAVLIARNEARCITRCLDSLRPWVDHMVVLDTGSVDDTAALARAAGADVYHFPWPDSFAVARNQALELADADWNLVLDADEWVETGGDTLRRWCEGPPRLGSICIHSGSDHVGGSAGAASTGRHWITRLLPRGVRYEGRVHEQPISSLPRERLGLHVGHDGYLKTQLEAKRGRNRPLLLLELQDRPGDPYLLYQLGTEDEGRADYAAACANYAQALASTPACANWRHALLVRHLHCLGAAGRADEALSLAEAEMPAWGNSPDFFFVVGNLALERATTDPKHALEHWLPLASSAWNRCLEIGERPDLEGSVEGRGSHLARHNLDVLRSQLARLAG